MKDKNHVYYQQNMISGAKAADFEVLGYALARDKENVYFAGEKIGADRETVQALSEEHYKDKDSVYYNFGKINYADLNTFEVMKDGKRPAKYSKDKEHVYFGWEQTDADAKSFVVLGNGYYKDKNFVYYENEKIDGVDAKSFEVLGNGYFRDKNNVYFEKKKLNVLDIKSFRILGNNYAADDKAVYYKENLISGIDMKTFEVMDSKFLKDKNSVYLSGEKLEGIDAASFGYVDEAKSKILVKDKNHEYILQYYITDFDQIECRLERVDK